MRIPDCNEPRNGTAGASGSEVSIPIEAGQNGIAGPVDMQQYLSFPKMEIIPSPAWLSVLLRQAEINLVNLDYSAALSKIGYIQSLIRGADEAVSDNIYDSDNPVEYMSLGRISNNDLSSSDGNAYNIIYNKCSEIVDNMSLGLDPFGRNLNYVPLLSFDFIQKHVKELLDSALLVEEQLNKLADLDENQELRISALKKTTTTASETVDSLKKDMVIFSKDINSNYNHVLSLLNELELLYLELVKAEANFKSAVRRESNGCGFLDVVAFAAMVATVVMTAGAAAAAVAAAGTAASELKKAEYVSSKKGLKLSTIKHDSKTISKIIKPAGEKFDEFQESYAKAKAAIDEFNAEEPGTPISTNLPSDHVKLVAGKADFDASIKDYMNLPEARKYKQLMDTFVSTAELRNNKILEHDMLVSRINDARTDILLTNYQLSVLSGMEIEEFDFQLENNLNFMEAMLSTLKVNIIRNLSNLSKSVEYIDPDVPQMFVSESSISALVGTYSEILDSRALVLERFGSPAAVATDLRITLGDLITEETKRRFINGEKIMFSLPSDSENDLFPEFFGVKTLKIGLAPVSDLNGKKLSVRFEHQGRSLTYDRTGLPHVYTHVKVPGVYKRSSSGHVNHSGTLIKIGYLEGSNRYTGVSPYGPWRLDVPDMSETDRENILKSDLTFDISGRVRYLDD